MYHPGQQEPACESQDSNLPDLVGSAQYTCPWAITIRRIQVCVSPPPKLPDPGSYLPLRRLDSSPRSLPQDRAARCILLQPQCKTGFVTSLTDGRAVQLLHKPCQELKSLFSYRKYDQGVGSVQTPPLMCRARRTCRSNSRQSMS